MLSPSQSANDQISSASFQLVLLGLTVALVGCSGPYVRSQQGLYGSPADDFGLHGTSGCGKGNDCWQACQDGQLKLGLPRPILHAIAGPFIPREIGDPYQSPVHPPHSKFHPVPTRPVFAPLGASGPQVPHGPAFMVTPSPTLAPQSEAMQPADDDQSPRDQPRGTGVSPQILPSQTPEELIPPLDNEPAAHTIRLPHWGEMPTQPAIRAASAEARFIEL